MNQIVNEMPNIVCFYMLFPTIFVGNLYNRKNKLLVRIQNKELFDRKYEKPNLFLLSWRFRLKLYKYC